MICCSLSQLWYNITQKLVNAWAILFEEVYETKVFCFTHQQPAVLQQAVAVLLSASPEIQNLHPGPWVVEMMVTCGRCVQNMIYIMTGTKHTYVYVQYIKSYYV